MNHEAAEKFSNILKSIADGVIATDVHDRVVFMNRAAGEMTGWAESEALGRPISELLHLIDERTGQRVPSPRREGIEGGRPVGDPERKILISRTGCTLLIDDSMSPVRDEAGVVSGAVIVFRDVTHRREIEESIRKSEERFRALIHASSDVIYRMNPDWTEMQPLDGRGRVTSNSAPIRDWIQRNIPEFEHARVREAFLKAMTGRQTFELEHQVIRPDGSLGWTSSRTIPILDERGEILEWLGTASDISQRKQAEEERERLASESDRQRRIYEAAISNTPDLVYVFDLNHRFVYANEALLAMWGRPREDAIGKNCLELGYEPWHAEMHDREIEMVIATRGPIRGEVPFTGTSGRRIYDYIFVPVVGPEGDVVAVAGTTRDVTERHEAEESLRISEERLRQGEERFRAFMDNNPAAAWITDVDGRLIYLSATYLKMFRMPDVESIGRSAFELYPEELARDYVENIRAAAHAGRPVEVIEGGIRVDGSEGRFLVYKFPLADPSGLLVGGVAVDITEREQAERRLRESEERVRLAVTAANIGYWSWDPSTGHAELSESSAAMFGVATHLRMSDLFDLTFPEDRVAIEVALRKAFDGNAPFRAEFRIRTTDGSARWMMGMGNVIRSDDGRPLRMVGVNIDITDRKQSEAERERLVERLREADRRKDEFLAMLAHELRNPLGAVSNAVAVLKISNDPKNINFAKDVVERQTRQLARLIDDLLDVSRITSGKIRLRREPCDAVTILRQAVDSVEPLVRERKHRLIADFAEESLPLRADPTRVEQIVVNLLTNAAKYSEDGGCIRLSARRECDAIVVSVADTGVGIPPERLPQMFELFAQGERSIARSEGGLGIGLTIVQKLTELHGGAVAAESEGPGKGSTFTVRLPASAVPVAVHPRPGSPAVCQSRGARILVVDDNQDTAHGMATLLDLLGNEVRVAEDGPSAIDVSRSFRPEYVLLDIGLPGMDGYEVARRLRQDPCCRASVIIAISGYGQEEDRRRSRDAGFDHHLVKPVEVDQLVALMSSNT